MKVLEGKDKLIYETFMKMIKFEKIKLKKERQPKWFEGM